MAFIFSRPIVSCSPPDSLSGNNFNIKTHCNIRDVLESKINSTWLCFVVHFQNRHFTAVGVETCLTENDSPLKRQKDKSKINFYYLLTVCKLQTVNPSQMISENAEDDQTNTIIWYSSEVKQNKSTPDVISTVRGGRSFTRWYKEEMNKSFLQSCTYAPKTEFYSPKPEAYSPWVHEIGLSIQ